MDPEKRRSKIIKILEKSTEPQSASAMADMLSVSRQVIVGDVALLRASGFDIEATPRGYVIDPSGLSQFPYVGTVACKHYHDRLKEELYSVVDLGGTVIDVTIDHALYGQLSGLLDISSRRDVDLFCEKVKNHGSQPLSILTDGIHIHRIGCKDEETFKTIEKKLKDSGIGF